MVHGTPQRREEVEDVGVVVQDRATRDVGVEANARLHVQARVKVGLLLRQLVLSDHDLDGGEVEVRLAAFFRAPQHHLVEDVVAQRRERGLSRTHVAIFDDGVRDLALEARVMHEADVSTVRAVALSHEAGTLARAALLLAVVEREGPDTQEPNQRVQLPYAVLERRAREAPLEAAVLERVRRERCAIGAPFDSVRLIQDDAGPGDGMQRGVGKVQLDALVRLVLRL
mmetsp:Transcript_78898/g.219349  ORF Transcript_78898/g.219349 Transcript_78898/m.219349 type:complete len:227 (+) Transcript_78898:1117-1797(+)